MIKISYIFFHCLIFSQITHAKIFLIPYGGYKAGNAKVDPNVTYQYQGYFYGVGGGLVGKFLGLGGVYEKAQFNLIQVFPDYYLPENRIIQKINEENKGWNILVTNKYFHLWMTHIIESRWKIQSGGLKNSQLEGSGLGIGMSLKMFKYLYLNGEYRYTEYTKFIDSYGKKSKLSEKYKAQAFLCSMAIALLSFEHNSRKQYLFNTN